MSELQELTAIKSANRTAEQKARLKVLKLEEKAKESTSNGFNLSEIATSLTSGWKNEQVHQLAVMAYLEKLQVRVSVDNFQLIMDNLDSLFISGQGIQINSGVEEKLEESLIIAISEGLSKTQSITTFDKVFSTNTVFSKKGVLKSLVNYSGNAVVENVGSLVTFTQTSAKGKESFNSFREITLNLEVPALCCTTDYKEAEKSNFDLIEYTKEAVKSLVVLKLKSTIFEGKLKQGFKVFASMGKHGSIERLSVLTDRA